MWLERLSTMRRPDHERPAPPVPVRRAAALVAVLLYPALTLGSDADLTWLRDVVGPIAYAGVIGILVLLWIVSFTAISTFRRQLAQAPDHQLDERERAVRDEAHVISYRILGWVLASGALWALVAAPFFGMDREVSLDVVLSAFFSLTIVSVALPSAVVAWRDTDEDDVDDLGGPDDAAPVDQVRVTGQVG